jgi:Short C-terminal domain
MPRLMRAVARTAVVAGTATAVAGRVQRRQANRWSEQEQAANPQEPQSYAAPPAAGLTTEDKIAQLKELGELKEAGVLTGAEFEAQKAKILAG